MHATAGYLPGAAGFLPMASHPAVVTGANHNHPMHAWPAAAAAPQPGPLYHPQQSHRTPVPASMSPLDTFTPADAPTNDMRPPPVPTASTSGDSRIFPAVYSSVPVYEFKVADQPIMRRRVDSWINATQILKCANIAKAARTRILERDIMSSGPYEKVQGGYGKYQGTWVPLNRARQLAQEHGMLDMLQPIFAYQPTPTEAAFDATLVKPDPVHPPAAAAAGESTPSSTRSAALDKDHVPPTRKRTSSTSTAGTETPAKRPRVDSAKLASTPQLNGTPSATSVVVAPLSAPASASRSNASSSTSSSSATAVEEVAPRQLNEALPPSKQDDAAAVADAIDVSTAEQHRQMLMSLFMETSPAFSDPNLDLRHNFPQDLDPDLPIDDQLHTAVHWAAALAKTHLVGALVAFGAEPRRGNHVGETALIRAVLATNNQDNESFSTVLEHLASSIRTTDALGRTVLHHAALVAGVKGRAASAKYYMETVLEFVAQRQEGDFEALVDAQDTNGDSALHIAARVGAKPLIRMLLETGAARDRPNKLGLRPVDFGVGATGSGTPRADDPPTPTASNSQSARPSQADEAARKISETLNEVARAYAEEMQDKGAALDETRAQLRAATRDLTEQRRQIEMVKSQMAEREDRKARIAALEAALAVEPNFDTTGRTDVSGQPATHPAFQYTGPQCLLPRDLASEDPDAPAEPNLPSLDASTNKSEALARSRSLAQWYRRMVELLRQRLGSPTDSKPDLERTYQRIISICCKVPLDQVETMLPQLLVALESDGAQLDPGRVAEVMKTAA